jgi:hypothetical protein
MSRVLLKTGVNRSLKNVSHRGHVPEAIKGATVTFPGDPIVGHTYHFKCRKCGEVLATQEYLVDSFDGSITRFVKMEKTEAYMGYCNQLKMEV